MVQSGAAALLATLAASCATMTPAPSPDPEAQASSVTLSVDQPSYAVGDTIVATLVVTNRTGAPQLLRFATTQRYDFSLTDGSGSEIWRWAADRAFGQMIGEETLEPGGQLSYTQRVRVPSTPGNYRLAGTVVVMAAPLTASTPITVRR